MEHHMLTRLDFIDYIIWNRVMKLNIICSEIKIESPFND